MEKLIVGPAARGHIDLDLSLEINLHNTDAALDKPLTQLTVAILAKPRHDAIIAQLVEAWRARIRLPERRRGSLYDPSTGQRYTGSPAAASRGQGRK